MHVKYSDIFLFVMFLDHFLKYQERVMSASYEYSEVRSTQREHIFEKLFYVYVLLYPISVCEVRTVSNIFSGDRVLCAQVR